jgi:hypothetical protein
VRRAGFVVFCALALLPRVSRADDAYPGAMLLENVESKEQATIQDAHPKTRPDGVAGMFTTLGSYGRMWELRSDTAFSTTRVFTERLELAHMIGFSFHKASATDIRDAQKRLSPRFGAVVRASFGLGADVPRDIYNPAGPIFGVGLRTRSESDNEWIELGARVIPNYPGPQNADPGMISLALHSTTSSGIADDAAWLPLSSWGAQLYLLTQVRTQMIKNDALTFAVGAAGGGYASLGSLEVTTWLGPQRGFVGNVFVEAFFTLQQIGRHPMNLQLGGHAEASLSACWPGNEALPVLASAYLAWSPIFPVSVRVFYGTGGSLLAGVLDATYGARVQLYLP